VSAQPFPGVHPSSRRRTPAPGRTVGPGYDRNASLENIRENYEFLPGLLNQTLPQALSDPGTAAGLQRLRENGWLHWHMLIAITNMALNIRAGAARPSAGHPAGTAGARAHARDRRIRAHSLAVLTQESLSSTMQVAMLAIARRR
jgi:hypothetical protein